MEELKLEEVLQFNADLSLHYALEYLLEKLKNSDKNHIIMNINNYIAIEIIKDFDDGQVNYITSIGYIDEDINDSDVLLVSNNDEEYIKYCKNISTGLFPPEAIKLRCFDETFEIKELSSELETEIMNFDSLRVIIRSVGTLYSRFETYFIEIVNDGDEKIISFTQNLKQHFKLI